MERSDTAHTHWNRTWRDAAGRKQWSDPDPQVVACAAKTRLAGAHDALDLGCGVGRHALALARLGYATSAIDGSESGIEALKGAANDLGLAIDAHCGLMTELPFGDNAFDLVICFNVIYHGAPDVVQQAIDEITRVTRAGGTLFLTMLSKRNTGHGVGVEVAPGAFVVPDAPDDKVHPHFYCDAAELTAMLPGFDVRSLVDHEHRPGHWHWHLVAERR